MRNVNTSRKVGWSAHSLRDSHSQEGPQGRPTWLLDTRRRFGHEALVLVELPARLILKIDIQARFSVTAMMHEIDSMTTHVGAPKRLLIENVPRHHSQNLVRWCAKRGIELEYLPPFGPKVVTARIYRNLDAAIVALGPRPTVDACRMIARAMEAAMNMSRDMAAMYDA